MKMSALDWLWDNKTWVFSGIGVFLLGILINAFRKPAQKQHARAGTSVTQMQAGRDIINMNVGPQRQPPNLRLLAHRAYFDDSPYRDVAASGVSTNSNQEEHFFIKIVNMTPESVEVTHVWYQNGRRVDILNRPLPVRLQPNEIWETYVPVSEIPSDVDPFNHFHALISTGEEFVSVHNKNVAPKGYVA